MKGRKTGGRNFKPGQSGNPSGAVAVPEDIKEARKLTRFELERILNKYLYMNAIQIEASARNPETTGLELMMASLVSKATLEGDYKRMAFILDRLGFVVTQNVNVQGEMTHSIVAVGQMKALRDKFNSDY